MELVRATDWQVAVLEACGGLLQQNWSDLIIYSQNHPNSVFSIVMNKFFVTWWWSAVNIDNQCNVVLQFNVLYWSEATWSSEFAWHNRCGGHSTLWMELVGTACVWRYRKGQFVTKIVIQNSFNDYLYSRIDN